jgi:hypothetical protein
MTPSFWLKKGKRSDGFGSGLPRNQHFVLRK